MTRPFVFYPVRAAPYLCAMATTFINPPATATGPVLTSDLYSLKATTDLVKVKAQILMVRDHGTQGNGYDLIFSTTVYAFDGVVELSDIGILLDQKLEWENLSFATFRIFFDDAFTEFTAIHCSYSLAPGFDHTTCFLTSTKTAIVHPGSAISLTHLFNYSYDYPIKIVGLDPDGSVAMIEHTISKTPVEYSGTISFAVADLIEAATSAPDNAGKLAKVSYFAVNYGQAQKIFYILDHPFYLTFRFRNMFNAIEYIDIVCTVTRRTKAGRESAFFRGTLRQYDRTVEQTYEVHTAGLTDDQVRDIEQLILSHSVKLCAGDTDYDILIEDHTLETDNDDESLPSVTFTFRFPGRRPVLTSPDMGALMPSASHIFTQQFTAEFT